MMMEVLEPQHMHTICTWFGVGIVVAKGSSVHAPLNAAGIIPARHDEVPRARQAGSAAGQVACVLKAERF